MGVKPEARWSYPQLAPHHAWRRAGNDVELKDRARLAVNAG